MNWPRASAYLLAGSIGVLGPATAHADVLEELRKLAPKSPPPLVPVDAPAVLGPLDESLLVFDQPGRRNYSLSLQRRGRRRVAEISLTRGNYRSVSSVPRIHRRLGDRFRATRVRGRRAYLVRSADRRGGVNIVWSEGGSTYSIATNTLRRISIAQLRAAAAGLERFEGFYSGASSDPDFQHTGSFVATASTVSGAVDWTARCGDPQDPSGARGTTEVVLLQRRGNSFSFPVRDTGVNAAPWAGSVSGTVGRSAIDLTLQASAVVGGEACGTGTASFSLSRQSR